MYLFEKSHKRNCFDLFSFTRELCIRITAVSIVFIVKFIVNEHVSAKLCVYICCCCCSCRFSLLFLDKMHTIVLRNQRQLLIFSCSPSSCFGNCYFCCLFIPFDDSFLLCLKGIHFIIVERIERIDVTHTIHTYIDNTQFTSTYL